MKIENLTFGYNDNLIFKAFNLEVESGKITEEEKSYILNAL